MIVCKRERILRDDKKLYLDRFILFRCAWFGIYLHKFISSDDACHHCHPWGWISFMICGSYTEETLYPDGTTTRQTYRAPRFMIRKATHTHRVELPPGTNPVTLVLRGPKTRSWGFHTPRWGFIPWRKYDGKRDCN